MFREINPSPSINHSGLGPLRPKTFSLQLRLHRFAGVEPRQRHRLGVHSSGLTLASLAQGYVDKQVKLEGV